jgi:hypothetical protein
MSPGLIILILLLGLLALAAWTLVQKQGQPGEC